MAIIVANEHEGTVLDQDGKVDLLKSTVISDDDIGVVEEAYKELGGTDEDMKRDTTEKMEALTTDPDFLLTDVKILLENHGISLVDLLNAMGMNEQTLKVMVMNKSISEQIAVLNRELSLIIFKMGVQSGEVKDGYSTLTIRSLLGEIMPSEDWLKMMDELILPYIAYVLKHGVIDKDFFEKNKDGDFIAGTSDSLREILEVHTELYDTMKGLTDGSADLFDEEGNFDEDKVASMEGRVNTLLNGELPEDAVTVEHGTEEVLETTEGEVEDASRTVDTGDIDAEAVTDVANATDTE